MAWRLTLSFAAGSIIFLRSPTGPLCRARRTKNHSPAPTLQSWHAASSRRSQARASLSPHRQRPPAFQQLVAPLLDLVRLSADCMQSLAGKRWTSKSCASSIRVFSPSIAPTVTLALKAGLWFRRGRLVMVISSLAASCCCYAENPPIPAVQFSRTTPPQPSRLCLTFNPVAWGHRPAGRSVSQHARVDRRSPVRWDPMRNK